MLIARHCVIRLPGLWLRSRTRPCQFLVTIRVYEADNHLFFPGTGPSTPAEYAQAHHVDPAVVSDIAAWLMPQRGKLARFVSGLKRHQR